MPNVSQPAVKLAPISHDHDTDNLGRNAATIESRRRNEHVGNQENGPAPWRALFNFTTRANLPVLSGGIFVSVVAGAVTPAQSYIVGRIFEGFIELSRRQLTKDEFSTKQIPLVVYLVAVGSGSWVLHFLEFSIWIAFGELQAKSARDRLFAGLLKKDIGWYDLRKNGIGALLPRLQAQIRDLQLATSQPLGTLVTLSSTAVLSLVQSFALSWKLTLVTLASAPFVVAFVIWLGKGMGPSMERQSDKLAEAQKFTTNAFASIETVKCFNGQAIELQKYRARVHEAAVWYFKIANRNALQMASVAFLMITMFVQGFYYGGVLIRRGEMRVDNVVTCFLSAVSAFSAVQSTLPQMIVFEKGRIAGVLLRAVMAQVEGGSNVETRERSQVLPSCRGDIEVKNVSFAYPSQPTRPVLKNVSFFIPSGETTFLIGKSGSGKSTLGQLLLRFYSASRGGISIDGHPLESLDLHWLRSNITLVEQASTLFNDTIFNNIAMAGGAESRSDKAKVYQAIEFSLLRLVVDDLPDGAETAIGTRGGPLSGGQVQRVAIARARLRDTPILILDESTSALDQISRMLLVDAIRRWRHGKTTIIITHDIAQIQADDHAFVLESGRLVQDGTRAEMEALPDTPFEKFLPGQAKMAGESRPGTCSRLCSSGESTASPSSRKSFEEAAARTTLTDDTIDARLEIAENNRRSLVRYASYHHGSPHFSIGSVGSPFVGYRGSFTPLGATHEAFRGQMVRPDETTVGDDEDWGRDSVEEAALVNMAGQKAFDARCGYRKRERHDRRDLQDGSPRRPGNALQSLWSRVLRQDKTPPRDEAQQPATFWSILSTFWPSLNWSQRVVALLGLWGCTVHAAVTPLFSFLIAKLIATYATPKSSSRDALIYSMLLLAIAAVEAVHVWCYRMCLEYAAQRWVDVVRCQAVERILDQPREFFDKEENAVSRMTECLDGNAEEMRNLPGRFAGMIYCAVIMIFISVCWALVAQWKMTLVAMAVAPYMLIVTRAFAKISGKWEARSSDASEDAGAILDEVFTNIRTVRALLLEHHFFSKYLAATKDALRTGFQRAFFVGFFYGMSDSAGIFCTALILFIGVKVAQEGANVTDVIQVFTMLLFAVTNVGAILEYMPQVGLAKDTGGRMMRLAHLPKDSHEYIGDTDITYVGDIRLNGLSFSYPSRPEVAVLSNVDLVIPAGSCTAIVGGSGSGKSTIANLLLDLYTTASMPGLGPGYVGDLSFAHRAIKTVSTPSLRSLVTVVSQRPTIFAGTVRENITYGLPPDSRHSSLRSVTQAAQRAGIHDFIASLPYGYDTVVGEGGVGLSGGQLQRLAIARALVRQPAVLILDEATSALDPESAGLIRHTLQQLVSTKSHAMTVIIITHHRDMMEIAEQVVVMEHGEVVEAGAFNKLLRSNGALVKLLSGGEWDFDGKPSSTTQAEACQGAQGKGSREGKSKMYDSFI
ncbi:putative ABC transporter [Polychaeton citri CBS 116435]|uniref:ABC transporter n=1 Tax=Polychaeton citri CBS 116435 TaxID=1314669 RepID=A0A9P4QBM3_9PEZI|nr:putative ABC transporter [Polychaeton citri CBS 116435]